MVLTINPRAYVQDVDCAPEVSLHLTLQKQELVKLIYMYILNIGYMATIFWWEFSTTLYEISKQEKPHAWLSGNQQSCVKCNDKVAWQAKI